MLFGFVFTTNAFATITGNNSISTAYDMGYWQYQNYDVTYLAPDQSEAYYKFTANAGDKVYARTSYDSYTGMSISTVTNGGIPIETKTEVINVSSYDPFIFVNIDSTSNGQVFI